MANIILVYGLPGSGKTTFSKYLNDELFKFDVKHFNADEIREQFNDWDFSSEGRIRQMHRMFNMARKLPIKYAICDFVCPYKEGRDLFKGSYRIFLDTITKSRFDDTNKIFEQPSLDEYESRIETMNDFKSRAHVIAAILQYQLFVFDPPSI